MKINKDRPIGRVLYIVEGSKTEFNLLQRIFCNILGFQYIAKRRNRESFYYKENNPLSRVAVINTSESNIKCISDEEYLENVFQVLINDYDFPVDKASIYYLFDRDPESNTDAVTIKRYISILKNPMDNDDEMKGGMLLLSYPCIESYVMSSFVNNTFELEYGLGNMLKADIGQRPEIQYNKLSEETMIFATNEFLKYLQQQELEWDIDEFSDTSHTIFDLQEINYSSRKVFQLFSMLTLSFIQLGIIELE